MSIEIFSFGLLITSTLTGLVTEAIKSIMTELGKTYRSNIIAGIVAALISAAIGFGYIIVTNAGFSTTMIMYWIAHVFMSWLCSMVGYDKVVQAISQFKTTKEEN